MSPMRQAVPAYSPRPPPTSMPQPSSRALRRPASSVPGGRRGRGQLREAVSLVGEQREPQLGQAPLQVLAHGAVSGPGRGKAFVEHRSETGVQGEDHRDRRGVVVLARRTDVVADEAEVEVPRLWRRLA